MSLGIGCVVTWAVFVYASQPSNEPRAITWLLIPFMLLASSVTDDRALGEVVYFGAQILSVSLVCFLALTVFAAYLKFRDED